MPLKAPARTISDMARCIFARSAALRADIHCRECPQSCPHIVAARIPSWPHRAPLSAERSLLHLPNTNASHVVGSRRADGPIEEARSRSGAPREISADILDPEAHAGLQKGKVGRPCESIAWEGIREHQFACTERTRPQCGGRTSGLIPH